MDYRIEKDSMGEVKVPEDRYWGAQTQRSFQNFHIGVERMPEEIINAFAILKKACAITNNELGILDDERCRLICRVCDEISRGDLYEHFPLFVWQTGSGTQSNMNANEVIARRGSALAGKTGFIHPNDHVNMSQSSNDTFPAAMHIAAAVAVNSGLIPALEGLIGTFERLEKENEGIIKTGRTHLQDAVPIAFSQEISGWRFALQESLGMIRGSLNHIYELPLGATAVGTGLNAPKGFDRASARVIADLTGYPFITSQNKFYSLTSKDEMVYLHGAIKAMACDLMKIANDIRWLSSGPRCGLGEIIIPENEPGSSIMPGKVNPTQCEAMTMIAVQVMGNDTAITMAASQGNFELNVFMPVIIYNFLQSVRLLSDGIASFDKNCISGIKANRDRMSENLLKSLMLVTALNPYIGYDRAAQTAKLAHRENISLKEACVKLGFMSADEFDNVFHPENMVGSN